MKINKADRIRIKKSIREQLTHPDAREVVLRTPFALNDAAMKGMQGMFPALKGARLRNEIDESLIGGVVIVDGSMIMDYSVNGKMKEVIQNLLES